MARTGQVSTNTVKAKRSKDVKPKIVTHRADKDKVPKTRRFRPGTQALRQVTKYRKFAKNLIPKLPFQRLVRAEVAAMSTTGGLRFQQSALLTTQCVLEQRITNLAQDARLAALHAKRTTVKRKDFILAARLNGDEDIARAIEASIPKPKTD